jgi:VWFA-related protein
MIMAGKPFGGILYQKTIESGFFTAWLPFEATKRIRESGRENTPHACLIVFCDRSGCTDSSDQTLTATPRFPFTGRNAWAYNRPIKMKWTSTICPAIARIVWVVLFVSTHLSAQQTNKTAPPSDSGKIVVEANSVLIPVVVRDSQGHSVGNLKKEDFQIFDKNKPQVISGFSIQQRAGLENDRPSAEPAPANSGSTQSSSGSAQSPAKTPERFIVFLFDDLHLDNGDLAQIQKVATKMIAESLNDSDLAAVVSTSGANSGLTRDRAKLQDAIMKLRVQILHRNNEHGCPRVDYYQAVRIVDFHDFMALDDATEAALACCDCPKDLAQRYAQEAANRAARLGDLDVSMTLGPIRELIRVMSSLPGQRTLILISPGFLTVNALAIAQASEILDFAARSNVTVSALDARGLYTGMGEAGDDRTNSARSEQNKTKYHRESMLLNEAVMAELADGTGGTYFHNSNDLEAGFRALTAVPEYVYLLEMSLQNVKRDGEYHPLKVKLDQQSLKLQARRGYFAPNKEKK